MNSVQHPSQPQPPDQGRAKPSRLFGQRIIKPRLQLKFSMAVFAILCVCILSIWLLGHNFVIHMARAGVIEKSGVKQHLAVLTHIMMISSVFCLVFAFGAALMFSHLIAGPVYRFEHVLQEMKGGDLSIRVHLRRSDELKDLAQILNETLSSLGERVTQERREMDRLLGELEGLSRALEGKGCAEEARRLSAWVEDLRRKPSLFKT